MRKQTLLFVLLLSVNYVFAQWASVASLPEGVDDARHHPVTFSIDGYGYLLTGTVRGEEQNDFMRYNPETDTWESLPDFPGGARSFSYGTSRGKKAYVGFGGFNGNSLNDFWEYDSETEEWTQLADCPCAGRYHPAFVQLEGKIFVGMGNNSRNLNDWWEYDIPSNTWTEKDDLPGPPRHHPFYFGIDSIAYVGFGHGNTITSGVPEIYNDFYQFDPSTDEWTRLNDFPGEARVAGTQFDFNGKGYVLSGDGDDHSFMEEGELWEYTPESDTWTQLESHPGSSRWAPGNFVIDNFVYFMCGLSTVRMESDMMRFELEPLFVSAEEVPEFNLSVFPNPAKDRVTIDSDVSQFSEIRLVNSFGQIVRLINTNQVDVRELENGLYYLQFFKDALVATEKIMVLK